MRSTTFGFLMLSLVVVCSCSAFKASPAKDSGFLATPERLAKDERFPFHAWWVKPGAAKSSGGKLYVAPIDTSYLNKVSDWSHIEVLTEDEIIAEARKLGNHFRKRMVEQFQEKEDGRFKIVSTKEESDGVLEVAIVELVPTDVVRNATGKVLGFLVPGGGLVSSGAAGTIAIEGRFIDMKKNEVVAEFKDRETGKYALVDLAGLTAFRQAEQAVEDWASQIVEILHSPKGATVADSSPFTLLPW